MYHLLAEAVYGQPRELERKATVHGSEKEAWCLKFIPRCARRIQLCACAHPIELLKINFSKTRGAHFININSQMEILSQSIKFCCMYLCLYNHLENQDREGYIIPTPISENYRNEVVNSSSCSAVWCGRGGGVAEHFILVKNHTNLSLNVVFELRNSNATLCKILSNALLLYFYM